HAGLTHRSGRSPRFLRASSSSGEGFFLSTLSQAAIFSVESSLSTHLSFSCPAAETGTLASVAADRVRTRTIFVMMVFPDCSQWVCRQGPCKGYRMATHEAELEISWRFPLTGAKHQPIRQDA